LVLFNEPFDPVFESRLIHSREINSLSQRSDCGGSSINTSLMVGKIICE